MGDRILVDTFHKFARTFLMNSREHFCNTNDMYSYTKQVFPNLTLVLNSA